MQRALAAALGIGVVCGALGFFVVLRRLAFVGVGISHSAMGGVALRPLARRAAARDGGVFAVAVALGIATVGRAQPARGGHRDRRVLLGLDGARPRAR